MTEAKETQLELPIASEMAPTTPKWNEPVPLAAPDGQIIAYACPQCWHVSANISGGEMEFRRDESRQMASTCCCCVECGVRVGERGYVRCDDCKARLEREQAVMRPIRQRQAEQEALAFQNAMGLALDSVVAVALRDLMSDISEEYYCAGWYTGLEFYLWRMLDGGDRSFGQGTVTEDEINRLRILSNKAGGWWLWDDDSPQALFITLDEWKKWFEEVESRNKQVL